MTQDPNKPAEPSASSSDLRLDSWKEIAAYLKRDIRTVQLWEKKEGLPIHRHAHASRSTVHAYATEIDAWQKSRRAKGQETPIPPSRGSAVLPAQDSLPARRVSKGAILAGAFVTLALLAAAAAYAWWSHWGRSYVYRHATIAVLPFEDLSADPAENYLADGLTDDLITALGRSNELQLISRTSTMRFKGGHESLPSIAQELHADLVLEGTVLYAGKRARITAQLIDAATDKHIWANSYERDLGNVISLQDEVADDVAADVLQKLVGRADSGNVRVRTEDPEARKAYLLGHFFMAKRNELGLKQAIVYFQQAIDKDPNYAPAYAGLADCYNLLSVWASLPEREAFAKAKQAALKALELDPASPEAHTSLAFTTYRSDWDFAAAERHFQQAIELGPNYATAHQWYGEFLGDLKKSEQSVAECRRAEDLDPLSTIVGSDLADAYLHAERYPDAARELQKMLAMDPNFVPAHRYLAGIYEMTGQTGPAAEEREKYIQLSGDTAAFEAERIRQMYAAGKREEAREKAATLQKGAGAGRVNYFYLAGVYTSVGQSDKAFEYLDKAYREHSWWLVTLLVDPELASLRNDPRFTDLARRVGLPAQPPRS